MHKRTFLESLASNSKGPIKYVSPNNRPYQTRSTLVDINPNETRFFFLFIVSVNKCGGSCNTFDDSYARI